MRTIIFDDNINSKSINTLIEAIRWEKDDEIEVYFSSGGGNTHMAEVLIDYINNSDKIYTFKFCGQIQSAAFTILCSLNCEKVIMDTAWGMIHNASVDVIEKEKNIINRVFSLVRNKILKKKNVADELKIIVNDENIRYVDLYRKTGIPEDKIKIMLDGKEAYFRNEELKQIFGT